MPFCNNLGKDIGTDKSWSYSGVVLISSGRNSGRQGGSNEYHIVCVWAEIRKYVYPCKPQFYYTKVEFKGGRIT